MFATHLVWAQVCLNEENLPIKLAFGESWLVGLDAESDGEVSNFSCESAELGVALKLRLVKYFKLLDEVGSRLAICQKKNYQDVWKLNHWK